MTISDQYILDHFDEAIEKGYIKAYFQPIVRTLTESVCCAEALARWEDPAHGLISPVDFIPVLERHDLIYRMDMAILSQTCAFYQALQDRGTGVHSFSVNFSRLDFTKPGFYGDVEGILDAQGVPHEAIKIEVTESVMFADEEQFQKVFDMLKAAGFTAWIDDFGSGYSSLGLLQDYAFDLLKIDMLFMRDFTHRSRQLVASIVKTSKALGILTLIEGVETQAQARFIKSIGCDAIQGFYYSKPLKPEDFLAFLSERAVESPDEKQYWNQVGRFDLLSLNPFDQGKAASTVAQSDIPLALIECTWGRGDYVYANDAYLASIKSLGFDSIQALEHFYNDKISLHYNPMKNLLIEAVMKETVQEVDYVSGDVFYKFRAKCIAKSKALNKAMVIATLSTFREDATVKNMSELVQYSQALYASYEHVNLCFPDKNASIRLFSKANFQTAHQLLGLRDGIRSFAEKEVHPDDRERYLRFFNMDTLDERVSSNKGFIQQGFRIHDMNEVYAWHQVRITLVPTVMEKMYIYTIQAMSDTSTRIAELLIREHPEMLE